MSVELRPKIYLVACLLALFLEFTYILASAPVTCIKCKTALVTPSREFPNELCAACVEQIKGVIAATNVVVPYEPPYPVDPTDPVVTLETSRGKIEIELFAKQAPVSTANFLRYLREHLYDGVIFHRIEDYLSVTGRYRGGYGAALDTIKQYPKIPSESGRGLDNRVGTVSLPHLDEDADSATSDFFFNLKDAPHYNRSGPGPKQAGYAVFGQVLRGYDVLDKMRFLPVKPLGPGWERMPAEPIVIRRASENLPQVTTGTVSTIDTRTLNGK